MDPTRQARGCARPDRANGVIALANLLERAYRGSRIGYTAACVYLRIKLPRWWDRLLRRAPGENVQRFRYARARSAAVPMRSTLAYYGKTLDLIDTTGVVMAAMQALTKKVKALEHGTTA